MNQTDSYHQSLLFEEHNTHMLMHHNTICNMLGKCQGHTLHMTSIHAQTDLHPAFNQVKRHHRCVCGATTQNPTEATQD